MKVNGSGPTTGPAGAAPRGRPAAGGFTVGQAEAGREAQATARVATAAPIGSLDALIALQAAEDAPTRRRRAIGRAGRLLDLMDEVKVALLDGGTCVGPLDRLARAVREARDGVDEPGLQDLLDQIETRAAVELAKREARAA